MCAHTHFRCAPLFFHVVTPLNPITGTDTSLSLSLSIHIVCRYLLVRKSFRYRRILWRMN